MCRAVLLSNAQTCGTVLVSPAIPSEPPVVVKPLGTAARSGQGRAVRARRSEPTIKMLRYQQHFTFFDQAKLDGPVRFINLSQFSLEKDLNYVLSEIVKQVEVMTTVGRGDSVPHSREEGAGYRDLKGRLFRLFSGEKHTQAFAADPWIHETLRS